MKNHEKQPKRMVSIYFWPYSADTVTQLIFFSQTQEHWRAKIIYMKIYLKANKKSVNYATLIHSFN